MGKCLADHLSFMSRFLSLPDVLPGDTCCRGLLARMDFFETNRSYGYMHDMSPLLTAEDIDGKVAALAEKISADYKDKDLVLVGVLKGAFVFLADLARKLTIPVAIDFVWCSSYGEGDTSTGKIMQVAGLSTDIAGRHVLIVEDILDTGLTIKDLVGYLESFAPESVKVCAFIDKQERRSYDIAADYTGHCVEKGFLVGYGLDYAEKYRHYPAIYDLKT